MHHRRVVRFGTLKGTEQLAERKRAAANVASFGSALFLGAAFRRHRRSILEETQLLLPLLEPFTGLAAAPVNVPVLCVARIQRARNDGFSDHWPAYV